LAIFERTIAHVFDCQRAVLYYVLTYGLTTIGAFGVVGVVERATGSDRMDAFLGLHKRNPVLAGGAAGAVSVAGRDSAAGRLLGQVQSCLPRCLGVSAGPVPFALVALAVALSAVSLYYYLQVLKRAYVMPAVDETPIKAASGYDGCAGGIAAAVVVLGCFPALLQGWIASAGCCEWAVDHPAECGCCDHVNLVQCKTWARMARCSRWRCLLLACSLAGEDT
jgi:NADH-quinone oxidoreductase subunit N